MKKIPLEIGIGIKWINLIGLILFGIGILTLIGTGLVMYSGMFLPLEIKVLYFFEVLSKNFYLTFLISIIISFIGFKIMTMEKFVRTELNINDKDLSFYTDKRNVTIRFNRITEFTEKKSKKKKFLILKSNRGELFNFRLTQSEFENLMNSYPNEIKTLGNNVYN